MVKWTMIRISKEAKEKLNLCKEEFLNHHPEMKHFKISDEKITMIITEYYLED